MTKPTKRSSSTKPSDKSKSGAAEDTKSPAKETSPEKETLKLRQEAAKPGTVAVKDTGPGDGKSAAADGGKVTAIESSVAGDSEKGRAAAQPKDKPGQVAIQPIAEDAPKSHEAAEGGAAVASSSGAPARNVTVRKTGFWPVAFGGIVAAGLGAGAAIWALPHLPAGWLPEQEEAVDAEAIKAEAVAAAEQVASAAVAESASGSEDLTELQAALDDHGQRIAALEQSLPDETASVDGGGDTDNTVSEPAASDVTGEVTASIAQLQERLDEQAAQLEELQARPTIEPETIARIDDLASRADTLQQEITSAAEETRAQLEVAQAETAKLQEAASETIRRAEAVVAIGALRDALDKGVTAQEAQETFEGAGMDAPEALQQDLPSLVSLQEGFGAAARNALRAVQTDGGGEQGGGNAVLDFLKAQTGARSVTPREGDDPDAVLSRANASVEDGDIAAALDEIEALPDSAKEAMGDWLSGATAYRDAQAALSDLSTATN